MAEVRSKGWLSSPTYKKRAEHEARTGCVQNMHQMGWTCERWAKASGEPVEFRKIVALPTDARGVASDVRIVRTQGKMWRMEIDTGFRIRVAGAYPANVTAKRKLDTPLLPGPVAMAIWFEVENSNGSVRFRQSENKAGFGGTVFCDDPPEP